MDEEELLDSPKKIGFQQNVFEIINWWEKKRILYNIILIFIELIMCFVIWNGSLRWGLGSVVLFSIIFLICANAFYTIGWGLEVLAIYYFKNMNIASNTRLFAFVFGVLLSLVITMTAFLIFLDINEY
jgi:hypothetical protein